MYEYCSAFVSDDLYVLLNGRGAIYFEASVEEDRPIFFNDEPQIAPPFYSCGSCSSDSLEADTPAHWASSELNENGPFEDFSGLPDFSERLSPGHLLIGDNYETSADSEDGCFVIVNSLPHSSHCGWSPDTFASQEKLDDCMEAKQVPDDPKFSEVQPFTLRCLLRSPSFR
jgi:hypothetical protein